MSSWTIEQLVKTFYDLIRDSPDDNHNSLHYSSMCHWSHSLLDFQPPQYLGSLHIVRSFGTLSKMLSIGVPSSSIGYAFYRKGNIYHSLLYKISISLI
jgi:hypothetical protein